MPMRKSQKGIQRSRIRVCGRTVPVMTCALSKSVPFVLVASEGEYPVYDDFLYEHMASDQIRARLYEDAIARLVPGRTVLDIGTGSGALWALACARAGACKVYAIEVLPGPAAQAREAVAKAGYAEVITVIEGLSTNVELPERVDVCVSEIIGSIASSEGAVAVLLDAEKRLVKPGGFFIPERCVSKIAAAHFGSRLPLAFLKESVPYLEDTFEAVGHPFDIRLTVYTEDSAALAAACISDAADIEDLRFGASQGTAAITRAQLTIAEGRPLQGFLIWIRLWGTTDTTPLDTLHQQTNWLTMFAPVSADGIPVERGDRVTFEFTRSLSDDGVHPDYRLVGQVERSGAAPVPVAWYAPHHACVFRATEMYRRLFPE